MDLGGCGGWNGNGFARYRVVGRRYEDEKDAKETIFGHIRKGGHPMKSLKVFLSFWVLALVVVGEGNAFEYLSSYPFPRDFVMPAPPELHLDTSRGFVYFTADGGVYVLNTKTTRLTLAGWNEVPGGVAGTGLSTTYRNFLIMLYPGRYIAYHIGDSGDPYLLIDTVMNIRSDLYYLPYYHAIAVDSPYLYFGAYSYDLDTGYVYIVDIDDIFNPTVVGSLRIMYDRPRSLGVKSGHLYIGLAEDPYNIRVFNVQDPTQPVGGGAISVSRPSVFGKFWIDGNYMYIPAGTSGVYVCDLTSPGSPQIVGDVNTNYALDIRTTWGYGFLADHNGGFRVLSVANPANPSIVGSLNIVPAVRVTPALSQKVYLMDRTSVHVIDVSNVNNPVEVEKFILPLAPKHIEVRGDFAYIAAFNSLRILDVSMPTRVEEAAYHELPFPAKHVYLTDSLAYIVDGNALHVLDVSDPYNPTEIGTLTLPGAVWVDVEGNYAFVAASSRGLRVVDVSNPVQPVEVGWHSDSGIVKVDVRGPYAYTLYRGKLRIYDVSYPPNPVPLVQVYDGVTGVKAFGENFVLLSGSSFRVVDVAYHTNPVEVASLPISSGKMYVIDSLVFLTGTYPNGGLTVIDVQDPYSPVIVDSLTSSAGSSFSLIGVERYGNDYILLLYEAGNAENGVLHLYRLSWTPVNEHNRYQLPMTKPEVRVEYLGQRSFRLMFSTTFPYEVLLYMVRKDGRTVWQGKLVRGSNIVEVNRSLVPDLYYLVTRPMIISPKKVWVP